MRQRVLFNIYIMIIFDENHNIALNNSTDYRRKFMINYDY